MRLFMVDNVSLEAYHNKDFCCGSMHVNAKFPVNAKIITSAGILHLNYGIFIISGPLLCWSLHILFYTLWLCLLWIYNNYFSTRFLDVITGLFPFGLGEFDWHCGIFHRYCRTLPRKPPVGIFQAETKNM